MIFPVVVMMASHDDNDTVAKIAITRTESTLIAFLRDLFEDDEDEGRSSGQLFDIKLEIDERKVEKIQDLVARVTFESFGTEPTPVDMAFTIVDENGLPAYVFEGKEADITVETEGVYTKTFEDAPNFALGNYTLVLKTLYNTDVEDEFTQTFAISEGRLKVLLNKIGAAFHALADGVSSAASNATQQTANKLATVWQKIARAIDQSAQRIADALSPSQAPDSRIPEHLRDHRYETVKVKVALADGTPLAGAELTLFSEPKQAVTNEEGEASFHDVEIGEHTLKIAYEGSKAKEKLFFKDDVSELHVSVNSDLVKGVHSLLVIAIVLVATAIGSLIFWYLAKRKFIGHFVF